MRQIRPLHEAYLSGRLSPLDVCRHFLSRIDLLSRLNLLITTAPDLALSRAEASANRYRSGEARGPLDGVPFVVKDNFCTRDILTTCASRVLRDFRPPYDATVVRRLEEAGAVLLGKANLDEFAMGCGSVDSAIGPSKNPWTLLSDLRESVEDDWYITGGSSGGSAGSVAGGLAVFALGSDTGGSVRNPASYCGVVGLKPGYGRVSRYGLIPLVNALDQPGIFATSAEDAALILSSLLGRDVNDSTSLSTTEEEDLTSLSASVSGLRVGIPREYHAPGLSREALDAWETAAAAMSEGGSAVDQVSLPHIQLSIKVYSVLCCAEVASNMARYDGLEFGPRGTGDSTEALYADTRERGFNDVVKSRIFAGNFFLLKDNVEKYVGRARRIWRLIHDDFQAAFRHVDLLLAPVTLSAARRHSWFVGADSRQRTSIEDTCTQAANLGGVAAVSVPIATNCAGMPLAVQIIAPRGREHLILSAAHWLESKAKFEQRVIREVGDRLDLS